MFTALYVITHSGIPLYTHLSFKSETATNRAAHLFSSLLSAILKFLTEIQAGETQNFHTETYKIHVSKSREHAMILIVDSYTQTSEEDVKALFDKANPEIDLAFLSKGEITISTSEMTGILELLLGRIVPEWEMGISSRQFS